jgi:serine protein kinase
MHASAELFSEFRESFVRAQDEELGLEDFLQYCKTDRMAYATAHECVLEAIGKPTLLNTAEDPRLSRIFQNRIIQTWDTFAEFHGMEDTLMSLYAYFLHAGAGTRRAQAGALPARPGRWWQVVARGEDQEALRAVSDLCAQGFIERTCFTTAGNPLGLFDRDKFGAPMEDRYGIPGAR